MGVMRYISAAGQPQLTVFISYHNIGSGDLNELKIMI